MRNKLFILIILLPLIAGGCKVPEGLPEVRVVRVDSLNRVDVFFDSTLFTRFIYPADMEKTVLFPLIAADGTVITRGFPLEPRPGERVDHPHHVGVWFSYGDVNGYDFWNNSYAVPAERKHLYGQIFHKAIISSASGRGKGLLRVQAEWKAPGDTLNRILLKEETSYIFSGDSTTRIIDRITRLTALGEDVSFTDNKEGLFGLRVDRAFEYPDDKPQIFTDANGIPTEVAALDNTGVTGHYHSSEGIDGLEAWGKRAAWVSLSGVKDGRGETIVIFDHPDNPGYPAYWHARGYGLFAVNNLGQKIFSDGAEELNFYLKAGESVTFRHRLALFSGSDLGDKVLTDCFEEFTGEDK